MSDVDWIVGRRSPTEPDLPSQSGMALDVPSLDVYVTRLYSSLFILTVLLDSGVYLGHQLALQRTERHLCSTLYTLS